MQQPSAKNGLSGYNSLNDPHLQNYFTNKTVTNYLKKAGVVTRKGEIVPDAVYRTNMANAERRRKAREQLTQELLNKSINLQRKYESEIQHRLEEIAKLELIRKIRLETRTSNNKFGFKTKGKKKPKRLREKEEGAISGGKRGDESVEPNSQATEQHETSPEGDTYTNGSFSYMSNDYRTNDYMTNTNDYITNDGTTTDYMTNDYKTNDYMTNDYMTNDYMTTECTPVTDHTCSCMNSSYQEGSRLSTFTDESYYSYCSECDKECMVVDQDDLLPYSGKPCLQDPNTSVRFHDDTVAPLFPTVDCMLCPCETCDETCCELPVTLMFVGCCSTRTDEPTEIHIEQQHNCDAVFCVYQQCHYMKDIFTFVSHHERDFPFVLYVYLNGLLHMKLNTCCEYKHLPGYRFGGKRGQFILVDVKGTSSCTLCEESFTKFQEETSESTIGVGNIKMEEEIVIDVPRNEVAEICVPVENTEMSMLIDLDGQKAKLKDPEGDTFEIYDSEETSSAAPSSVLLSSPTCQCHEGVVQDDKEAEQKCICTNYHSAGVTTESSHSPCSAESPVDEAAAEKQTSNTSCACSQHSDHHHHHHPCHCLQHDTSFSSNAPQGVRIGGGGNSSGSGCESVASNITGGAVSTGEKANAATNEDSNYEEDNEVTAGGGKDDDIAVTQVEEKDFDGDDEDNASAGDDVQSESQHEISETEQGGGQQQSPQMVLYYQNSNENNSLKRTSPQDSVSQVLYLDTNLLSMKLEQLQQQQQEGLQVEEQDQSKEQEDQSHEKRKERDLLRADAIQDTDELHEMMEPVPEEEDNNTIHTSRSNNNNSDGNVNATTNNHTNNNDHNNNNTGNTPLDLVHKSTQAMLLDEQCTVAKAEMGACTSERGTQVIVKDMQKQQLGKSRDFRKSKNEEDTVSLITKFENSVLWKNSNLVLPESALKKQKTAPS
ncbi:uncharacterized protein LOC106883303 isoform X2 [Octopus bimaculoides]|uniref:DUF4590 domain-containing protein n=1 Tax=Octopus bimaculoides TaxID=37653 RepID=A0A0L8FHL7_OCTBM|nr:uncharacterized protein LOC106883303 isoform X2 [Octopus bimaculoides]|eukprot:XP_014789748.1 PREDICTED: uncharacterized protein LOC106883303 [Octopus bimaculoides]